MEGNVHMEDKLIAIFNFKQACSYINCGVQPVRLEYGKKGDLIFYFRESETKEVWERWKRKEDMLGAKE